MKRMLSVLAMVACSCVLFAAPTTYTNTYDFGCEGLIWDAANQSFAARLVGSNPTVQWFHPLPDYVTSSQLLSADLIISGAGIDNILCDWDGDDTKEQTDLIEVFMNGSLLGNLTGNVTTFALDPSFLQSNNPFTATLTFARDRRTTDCLWSVDTARLSIAELQVTFDDDSVFLPPSVVPAPGAVGLAGIGIVLVGWLRSRKTV